MGIMQQRKGKRREYEAAKFLNDNGIPCYKLPNNDVFLATGERVEIKSRKEVANYIYEAVEKSDLFGMVKANNKSWLVVIEATKFCELYRRMNEKEIL